MSRAAGDTADPSKDLSIERERLGLEVERFDLEKKLSEERLALDKERARLEASHVADDRRFLNRRFPVLATFAIGLGGILLSAAQCGVAWIGKAKDTDDAWLRLLHDYLRSHGPAIFGEATTERYFVRRGLISALPAKEAAFVASSLLPSAGSAVEADLLCGALEANQEGERCAKLLRGPRLFLQYFDPEDEPFVRMVARPLLKTGYRIPGKLLRVRRPNVGELRYFHAKDQPRAEDLQKKVQSAVRAESPQFQLELNPIIDQYSNIPEEIFEIWLPARGGGKVSDERVGRLGRDEERGKRPGPSQEIGNR
jgi:hypothetical protein